jgi:hypothetical protein
LAADVKAKKGQAGKYETKPEFTVGETFLWLTACSMAGDLIK